MNLGDVLQKLGDGPLQNHTWTDAIVSNLNAILPGVAPLSAASTGTQALAALGNLPELERSQLMACEVNLLTGSLTLVQSPPATAPKEEAKSEAFHNAVVKDVLQNPKSTLALLFGVVATFAVVILVVVMTYDYTKTGKAPDTTLLQALFNMLMELAKMFGNSN